MTAFTPGKWHCIVRPQRDIYEIFADGRDIPMDERAANCRLIEAAPDMAQALKASAQLIARGMAEGAYQDIAAGPGYAARVLEGIEKILSTIEGK